MRARCAGAELRDMDALRELNALITRHLPAGGGWKNDALGLMFASANVIQAPTQRVYEPVFALVVQGEKQLMLGDKLFTCGKGSFIVVSVDLPRTFASAACFTWL